MIDSFTGKIEELQNLIGKYKQALKNKDKEILKLRIINQKV